MYYRLLSGVVAGASLLAVMTVDAWVAERAADTGRWGTLLRHGSFIPLAFTVVALLCVGELARLLRAAGFRPQVWWAMSACTVLMLSPWLSAGRVWGGNPVDVEALQWQVIWLAAAAMGAAVVQLFRGRMETAIGDIGATWLIIVYLGFLPSFVVHLRSTVAFATPAGGTWALFIVLLLVFATDIGALYVGLALGRHRLAPSISPGKTVEGFVGGVAASVIVAIFVRAVATAANGPVESVEQIIEPVLEAGDRSTAIIEHLSFTQLIVFAVVTSVIAQIGDLFESLLKRCAQVKDSAALIPGMGGLLDVVDGVLFAGPAAWFLLTYVWEVV